MKNLSILLCILSSLCLSQAHDDDDNSLCLSARRIVEGVCENENMGVGPLIGGRIGKQGPKGEKGDKAEPAVVDYERIMQKVEEMYSPVIDALIAKDNETMTMIQMLNESNKLLERENERKEQQISDLKSSLEKLNATVQNPANKVAAELFCKVFYGGKCFWYVHESCTYSEAEAICATVPGGRPAVVYSAIHYEQLATYIRSVIDYTYFWLGLTINPSTKEVTIIPEGTPAPFLKWISSYPNSGSGYTSVTVQLFKDPSDSRNGMFNNRGPTSTTLGVLCEA